MASGKKGKKTKGKTLALTDFLQETPGSVASAPVRKSNLNWADEVEDVYDPYESRNKVNVVLPTAPKASRNYEDINEKIPKEPPFIAYLSNLPYDVDEDEIADFFRNLKISNMRIPKDDRVGENSKLKGFGYIEFEDRESLIEALVIPDTTLKSRRIRIEVATNSDNDRRRGGRMDMNRDRDRSEVTSGDWRSGPRTAAPESERRGFSRDKDWERDGDNRDRTGGWRDNREERPQREERSFSRSNMVDRERNNDRDRDGGGGGRYNERDSDRSRFSDRDDRGGSRYNERDSDRGGRFGDRDRDSDRNRYNDRERDGGDKQRSFRRYDNYDRNTTSRSDNNSRDDYDKSAASQQRRKLVLAPRSKPVETDEPVVKPDAAPPAASIFGNAKPVDTSIRERQIEERLAKETVVIEKTDSTKERRAHSPSERKQDDGGHHKREDSEKSPRHSTSEDDNKSSRGPPIKRNETDKRGGGQPKSDAARITEKPQKREEKRERHDKEMPKMKEPEPPNFAANNKFAFLETEEVSD